MGGRKFQSSPLSSPASEAKKLRTSHPPLSSENNPFWKVFGGDCNHAFIGLDNEYGSHDESEMVVDEENGDDVDQFDHIFDDMLQFVNLSNTSKLGYDKVNDNFDDSKTKEERNQIQTLTEKTVNRLLTHMRKFHEVSVNTLDEQDGRKIATTPNVCVSAEDVFRLLLPWSVREILQKSYKNGSSASLSPPSPSLKFLHWKTLYECLCFLSNDSRKEGERGQKTSNSRSRNSSLNVLTLSTMHKIVPIALTLALGEDVGSEIAVNDSSDSTMTMQEITTACFCRLVDDLYRPPLDVVCDTLLPILTRHGMRTSDKASMEWLSVVTSTFRLMTMRLTNANPKKSFQLLVRPKVFLDLATIHHCISGSKLMEHSASERQKHDLQNLKDIYKEFIRDGIFSLEHHMDGFRSLKLPVPSFDNTSQKQLINDNETTAHTSLSTKSSFRIYQEGLLFIFEEFLTPCDGCNDSGKFSSRDALIVSSTLPLFLSIFIEQVSRIQKQQVISKFHKKGKVIDKLGHLQFRFFSCLSGYLIKGLISSGKNSSETQIYDCQARLSFITMLGMNLDILMRHNVYQPSLGNSVERSFLNRIGKEIIQSMIGQAGGREVSYDEWRKSLIILDVLIQLNHTILHDRLAEILEKCLTHDSNDESNPDAPRICTEASSFFITIALTYGRLRQLDYFYRCLFNAIEALSHQNNLHGLNQHFSFANDSTISSHLGTIIQGSPIEQLKQVFSNINNSIASRSVNEDKKISREVTMVASAVVTIFFVGLLQNIRIDSNSFNVIYPICNDIMNVSVVSLLGSDIECTESSSRNIENLTNATKICAWTIHLKNRCEFWISEKRTKSFEEEDFDMPQALHRVLLDVTSGVGDYISENVIDDSNLLEALKFLACQRIQQLHRKCYEKQVIAYATDAEQYNTTNEKLEAQKLVGFILGRSDSNKSNVRLATRTIDELVVLTESIAIWAPYADENNIDSFFNQLLQTVSTMDASCKREGDMLLSVLNDSSFYEIPNVSPRFGRNIVSYLAENMEIILSRCDGLSSQQMEVLRSILYLNSDGSSITKVMEMNQSGIMITSKSKELPDINSYLRHILRVLDMSEKACDFIWKEHKDSSKLFQALVTMESICSILQISNKRSFLDMKVRLVSVLRITASKLVSEFKFQSRESVSAEEFITLIPNVLENTLKNIEHDLSPDTIHRCIHSCSVLVESLVNRYIAEGGKLETKIIEVLDSTFDQAEIARGDFQYLILVNYAIILLKSLGRLFDTDNDTYTIALKEFYRIIKTRLWQKAEEYCFNPPKDTKSLFHTQSTKFIADALWFSSTYSKTQLIQLDLVENKIVTKLSSLLKQNSNESEMRSTSYLVGCLAKAKPSKTATQNLLSDLLVANLKQSDIFLTPLCILATGMEMNEFDEFLSKLTTDTVEVPATVMRLRIVHNIILSATMQGHIDIISNHSAMIINNCLQVMTQVANQVDGNSDATVEVSSLIIDMASKRDVVVLRERDIARILARITPTINVSNQPNGGTMTEIQLKAYDACFSLVSMFLQRFSKQIHNCVPSLVVSMTTMLQFVLSESLPTTSMSNCGQKYSRLCELLLPHGDVYKKHVICLILRFVNSLRNDIHPICKKSLLPGIYCLLDIIQEHETMQLNSMLDEECRALLRTIHDGYKKIHVYKGQ